MHKHVQKAIRLIYERKPCRDKTSSLRSLFNTVLRSYFQQKAHSVLSPYSCSFPQLLLLITERYWAVWFLGLTQCGHFHHLKFNKFKFLTEKFS